MAAGVRGAWRRVGKMTPCTPAASALRSSVPTFCGSSSESRTRTNGGSPRSVARARISSSEANCARFDDEGDALVAIEPGHGRQRAALDLDDRDPQARGVEDQLLEGVRGVAGRRAGGAPSDRPRMPPRPADGRRRAPRPARAGLAPAAKGPDRCQARARIAGRGHGRPWAGGPPGPNGRSRRAVRAARSGSRVVRSAPQPADVDRVAASSKATGDRRAAGRRIHRNGGGVRSPGRILPLARSRIATPVRLRPTGRVRGSGRQDDRRRGLAGPGDRGRSAATRAIGDPIVVPTRRPARRGTARSIAPGWARIRSRAGSPSGLGRPGRPCEPAGPARSARTSGSARTAWLARAGRAATGLAALATGRPVPAPRAARRRRSAVSHGSAPSDPAPALAVPGVLDDDPARGELVTESVRRGPVASRPRGRAGLEHAAIAGSSSVSRVGQDRRAPGPGRAARRAPGRRPRSTASVARSGGSARGRGRTRPPSAADTLRSSSSASPNASRAAASVSGRSASSGAVLAVRAQRGDERVEPLERRRRGGQRRRRSS